MKGRAFKLTLSLFFALVSGPCHFGKTSSQGNCCKVVSQSASNLNGAQLCRAMKMAQPCKEGAAAHLRRSELSQNYVPAQTFHCGISVKIYPSSCDLCLQYRFMSEMYWFTVHLLLM